MGRGPARDYTFNGIEYTPDISKEMITAAIARLSEDLPEDQGVSTTDICDFIGARDPETRHQISVLLGLWKKPTDKGRRPPHLNVVGKGVRLARTVKYGLTARDQTAFELLTLIRQDGGITTGRRLRWLLDLKGGRAKVPPRHEDGTALTEDEKAWAREDAAETSYVNQIEFEPYRKVLQSHPSISRLYRDAMGQDGLYALAPADLGMCVLSGFARSILIKGGLSAVGRPSRDDVETELEREGVRIGARLRELREHLGLELHERVAEPAVRDALARHTDDRFDALDIMRGVERDEVTARKAQLQSLKLEWQRDAQSSIGLLRDDLRAKGADPDDAVAVMKMDAIERGDHVLLRRVQPCLFTALSPHGVSAAELSKGLLRLDSTLFDGVEDGSEPLEP
jgi:hypothetical protein